MTTVTASNVTVFLYKLGKGNQAKVLKSSNTSIEVGTELSSKHFLDFKPGSHFNAIVTVYTDESVHVHELKAAWEWRSDDALKKVTIPSTPEEDELRKELRRKLKIDEGIEVAKKLEISTGRIVEDMPLDLTFKREKEMPMYIKDGYYISPEARLTFSTAFNLSKKTPERAVKIMIVGASGDGKTTLTEEFAKAVGMGFYRMNCGSIRDPEEWFGFREAQDGSTVFIPSHFMNLMQAGNVVMVLDEFNRLEPWLHNTLFPLLDHDGKTVIHDQEFKIGPNVIVAATINTGYKYTGVFELDEALYNRFDLILEVTAMPLDQEIEVLQQRTGLELADARKVVKMAHLLRERDVQCTVRKTLAIAELMVAGMTIREAFEFTIVKRLPQDVGGNNMRKTVVDQLNVEFNPYKVRPVPFDVFGGVAVAEESGTQFTPVETDFVQVNLRLAPEVGEFYNIINIIKYIRKVSGIGQKEAKETADRIKDGQTMCLVLDKGVFGNDAKETFLSLGVIAEIQS